MKELRQILIVDDEPWYRAIFNKGLKAAGYHTILAQNAQEALVALWEKDHIGLVLLDVRMPMMNGLNIFEIIRKDFPDKKIIVTSVLQKEEQRFLLSHADEYYDKSEDLFILLEKVYHAFNGVALSNSNERRKSRRMPVNILASCEKFGQETLCSGARFISYTKDLSFSGGRFMVHDDLRTGQHFSMALELPVNFLPVLIDCEVIWSKPSECFDQDTKSSVEVGVRFVRLDSVKDEEKLKNYLSYV